MMYLTERPAGRPVNQQTMKEENLKRTFSLIREGADMTRARLSKCAGLSATTVSALVDELVTKGLVVEVGLAKTARSGRKPIALRVEGRSRQIPVFSLNKWGVRYTLYDLNCQALESFFVPNSTEKYGGFLGDATAPEPDAGNDYADIIESVLLREARCFDKALAPVVCVAYPGILVRPAGRFSLSGMRVSFGEASMHALEDKLGIPLFFGNASMCMGYAEKKFLDKACVPVTDMIYVNVFEGVGAGIISGGQIVTGPDHSAGEIGHVTVDYQGVSCVCGGCGCLERYVNVEEVLKNARTLALRGELPGLLELAGDSSDNITLEMLDHACVSGLRAVQSLVDDVADKLFAGIYATICVTGIKRIVVGGGIERLGARFLHRMIENATHNRDNVYLQGTTIAYAQSGSRSDSCGIAQYYMDKLFTVS
ncbi:MAG: ROK family transcriptional regulator [Clostridia bacterium]